MVFLHSAWGVEPSVGLDIVEVGVASPKLELTVIVLLNLKLRLWVTYTL